MTDVPARSRGVLALVPARCTSCMACVRECPTWCITLDSHKEERPPAATTPGRPGRPRVVHVLDRFAIDFSLCMYCGICVEACPFDALLWSPEHDYAELDVRDLLHDTERLAGWVATVPPPPPLAPEAGPAKEELEAERPAAP